MSRIFYNYKNENCEVLQSAYFNDKSFKEREKNACTFSSYENFSPEDKHSLSGYSTL